MGQISRIRFALAVAATGSALMVWGMAFWAVLYEPLATFGDLPNQAAVAQLLSENDTATGTYFFPWPRNTAETRARWEEAHRRGPFFKLSYGREGVDPSSVGKLALGALHHVVVALIATLLIVLALPALPSFGRRFAVVFLAGAMGSVFIQIGDSVWFHLPWDYVRGAMVYELGAWTVMGAILAGLLRSPGS